MNTIAKILTAILLIVAAIALIPLLGIGVALLFGGGAFLIWLLPILLIAASDETSRTEKALWILAIIFLSWFAWIFYFFLAPLFPRAREYTY